MKRRKAEHSWMIAGNLFDPATDPPAVNECMIDGGSTQPLTLLGGANLSPDADCLFLGLADIQAAPLTLAAQGASIFTDGFEDTP